jgi:hypothetical protein
MCSTGQECLTEGFAIGHAVFASTGTRESSLWPISEMRKQFIQRVKMAQKNLPGRYRRWQILKSGLQGI